LPKATIHNGAQLGLEPATCELQVHCPANSVTNSRKERICDKQKRDSDVQCEKSKNNNNIRENKRGKIHENIKLKEKTI